MVKINPTIPLFFFVLLSARVFSQSLADTSFLAASVAKAKNVYLQHIKGNAHLYNGSEYKVYQSVDKEHPYFLSDDWASGSIVYDNEPYENVGMLYDIRYDKVIIEHYFTGNRVELVSKKISKFNLHGHTFVGLMRDSAKQIQEGFYDQLYNGITKVYARHIKQYQETIEANAVRPSFTEKNLYFILKDGKYFLVNSKASVLEVFGARKKMLKQYLRKSGIRYRKEKEKALVKLAEFYDTLKD